MDNENTFEETTVAPLTSSDPIESAPSNLPEQLIIGEELTEDDMNRIYKRLGRPETSDEYDFSEVVPEGYTNLGIIDEFKQKAHETGMSKAGALKMAEWYKDVETRQVQAMTKARNEQIARQELELRKEWGADFDNQLSLAIKARDAYAGDDPEFKKYMNETGIGSHPTLVKAFAKIGRELSEDRLVQSETTNRLAQNEELRRSEILRLRSDKQFMDRYQRGDQIAVQRLNKLYLDD